MKRLRVLGSVGWAMLLAASLTGCVSASQSLPLPAPSSIAPLEYSNQTSIRLELYVNDQRVATMEPGSVGSLSAGELPAQPWLVEARTTAGRVIAKLTVRAGDVTYGPNSSRGDAVRVNLSCGVLDIWSGPPLVGPLGGSGSPGDCE
jgi:hypothetical protein